MSLEMMNLFVELKHDAETSGTAWIKEYRESNELTLKDLSKRLGVSLQHLCDVENGRFSALPTIERIVTWEKTAT